MLRRIFVFFLLIVIALVWLSGIRPHQVAAEENVFYNVEQTSSIPTMTYEGVTYPDWENLSFSSIPPSTGSGSFEVYEMANSTGLESNELTKELGYDPSRSWEVGTPIEDILKLGDLKANSNLKDWTISNIAGYTGIDSSFLRLADFGLLNRESLSDVVNAVPLLGDYSLGDVKPLYDLVKNHFSPEKAIELGNVDLGSLSDSFEIGTIKLEELDLSQYDLTSIPNLENAKFGDFVKWEESFLSEIPGLADVPVASFLLDLVQGGFLAKLDVVWGEKEANRTNTISGSYKEGFSVPCEQKNCPHIELTDAVPSPTKPLHGKQWISGKAQKVKGGSGLLAAVGGGSEPTGRHPFGDAFKVVLTDTNESIGTASFSVYFRICGSIFLAGKTCTPYIIGPFPWFSHKEKDLVFVGVDGVESEVPDYLPPVPSQGEIPDEIIDQLPPGFQSDGDTGAFYDTDFSNNADDCENFKGVNMGALKESVEQIESRGVGGYYAVGPYAPCWGGCTIPGGHGLGKYQFMTFREEVQAIYSKKPGGMDILRRSYVKGGISKAELSASIKKYFPPEAQEKLFWQDMRSMMSKAYSEGHRGEQIVYMVAGRHHAGKGSFTRWYAEDVRNYYQNIVAKYKKKCSEKGRCTGQFITPTKGVLTSGFRPSHRPNHGGIDVANNVGTPLVAIDGGTIIKTFNGCPTIGRGRGDRCGASRFGGYGNIVLLKLCNGWEILYAHNQKNSLKVKVGDKVSKGQILAGMASSGSSTGPHLHFEVRTNGGKSKENPLKYVPAP